METSATGSSAAVTVSVSRAPATMTKSSVKIHVVTAIHAHLPYSITMDGALASLVSSERNAHLLHARMGGVG